MASIAAFFIANAAAIGAGAAVVGAGASIAGGISARKESKKQVGLQRAATSAKATAREKQIKGILAEQKLSFLKSGVTLEGTPLIVQKEQEKLGRQEVADIRQFGEAQSSSLLGQGRQALVGGLGAGVSQLGKAVSIGTRK